MIEVPPSIPFLLNRIAHYEQLSTTTASESQIACYQLVIFELNHILEQVKEV
jgi:hypothetical protein